MSNCGLTKGKDNRKCRTGYAGIRLVDFGNWEDIETLTIVSGAVTAMTLVDGARTYRYNLEEELGNFKDTFAGNRQNGSGVRTQTLLMPLTNFTDDEITELETFGKGLFFAIVGYADGRYRLAGHEVGLRLDTENDDSGIVHEDRNGTELTFSCKQITKAPFISATIVSNLQIPTS